ncbi:ABC transporter ATP-binding protein [Corynebacterium comes]|uniref:ABC-type quaternary amine transporter n=1 Tax=Corynebacterium comes TaxID=2675218 RepID=A0A6B8W8R7_9CORY|nr:ABC transporter ATP-binding protein [Corynebacterium comes]QGU03408.1 Trehalose import ATP-binding protein SugC [Corynebacterium comes]
MSAIDIHDLSVTFPDGTTGLADVNLSVRPEEFVALIGPSGSGKTTLLRTIAGFVPPSTGHVALGGEDVTRVPPEKRRIGMVFQQHAVWPHMTVAANVAYPLKMRGVDKRGRGERVDRALELVGLDGFAQRRPDSLSGGQRQRVALARAIIADPTALLLDEALSALDEPLRDNLRRELVTLTRREGLTTVHVTHDRSEALSIADRVVVLDRGRIQQIATPQDLVHRPATARVAAFIADAALLDASFTDAVTSGTLTWAPDEVEFLGSPTPELTLAVLPAAVEVLPAGTPGALPAEVRSVLYDSGDWSVTLDAMGTVFRAIVRGVRPEVGDQVSMRIRRPLAYPA